MRQLIRFFTPLVFFSAAAFVTWNNGQGGDILAFGFLGSIFPEIAGDPAALGRASVGLLIAVGVLTGVSAGLREVRSRGAQ